MFMCGMTTYLENTNVGVYENLKTGKMVVKITGDYRCDFG